MGLMLNSEDSLDSSTKSDHLYSNTKSLKRKMDKNSGKRGEAILAIYGDEDYFNSEPLIQKRIIVMVSLYLGPLACGYSSSLISLKQRGFRDPDGSPDWTDHSLLLGGLVASVLPLPLSLRAFGRLKTAAMVSMILFFATVMLMVSDTSGSTFWMSRLSEFSVGLALGLHLPTQQLIIAETARPHQRATFATLNYVMLSFGSLLAHLLSQIVPWVQGLCVLNMVVLVFHFFAVGFFHPETPRYLFAVKDKKAECANALQWLRGRMADIGQEYTDLADSILIHGPANPIDASGLDLMKDRSILQPLITAVTIMTLTSLTGLLNITFLLRSNLQLGHNSETTSTAGEIEKSHEIENISSSNNNLMDMGYIVAGVNVLVPLFTASLIHRIGQKMFLLVSSGLMAASLLFLTLLAHFQDNNLTEFMNQSPGFGWTVQTAIVAFISGHQLGAGPLCWLLSVELIPCKVLEGSLALASAVWWAFNLVFSMTLTSLVGAIGLSGLFGIHAIVSGLMYGFVLHTLPDIRDNSLQEIEDFYRTITSSDFDKKFRFSFRSNASSSVN